MVSAKRQKKKKSSISLYMSKVLFLIFGWKFPTMFISGFFVFCLFVCYFSLKSAKAEKQPSRYLWEKIRKKNTQKKWHFKISCHIKCDLHIFCTKSCMNMPSRWKSTSLLDKKFNILSEFSHHLILLSLWLYESLVESSFQYQTCIKCQAGGYGVCLPERVVSMMKCVKLATHEWVLTNEKCDT